MSTSQRSSAHARGRLPTSIGRAAELRQEPAPASPRPARCPGAFGAQHHRCQHRRLVRLSQVDATGGQWLRRRPPARGHNV